MDESEKRVREALSRVASKIRVSKIVATRTMKGTTGDSFAGFTGALQPAEETSGILLEDDEETHLGDDSLTLQDAKLAHLILAMTADTQAIDATWAAGGISADYRRDLLRATRGRYALLARALVLGKQKE